VHTQHTPANISVYIGVYIGMPAAVSGGVEECALDYTSANIIYRHISVYVSVPAAVSGGYRSAHTGLHPLYTDILVHIGIYIGIQWLPSAAMHMSAHCTQASFLCPLYIPIYIPIYIYIEFKYEYISIIFPCLFPA
jgi:hypothetical protein